MSQEAKDLARLLADRSRYIMDMLKATHDPIIDNSDSLTLDQLRAFRFYDGLMTSIAAFSIALAVLLDEDLSKHERGSTKNKKFLKQAEEVVADAVRGARKNRRTEH